MFYKLHTFPTKRSFAFTIKYNVSSAKIIKLTGDFLTINDFAEAIGTCLRRHGFSCTNQKEPYHVAFYLWQTPGESHTFTDYHSTSITIS